MKKLLVLPIIVSGVLLAETPKVYVDLNPVLLNYTDNGVKNDFDIKAFKWSLGYLIKDLDIVTLGVEGSALLGYGADKRSRVTNSDREIFTNATSYLDSLFALHLKGIVPINNNFHLNTYLGGSQAKLDSIATEFESSGKWDRSLSYGVGLEYWSSANVSIHANYMQYFKNLSAIEVGLGFKF